MHPYQSSIYRLAMLYRTKEGWRCILTVLNISVGNAACIELYHLWALWEVFKMWQVFFQGEYVFSKATVPSYEQLLP